MPLSSQALAEQFFTEFPDWRALARREKSSDGTEFLVIKVEPPPEAMVEHGLVIDTSNEEITIGFDAHHAHFNGGVGDVGQFGTEAAIEFINQILSEQTAVVSWWLGDECCGSTTLEAGSQLTVPSGGVMERQYDRVRVRSWLGTLNADNDA